MAAPCRYGALLAAAANLACAEVDPVSCDEEAAYAAIISTDTDGFVIEITAPVCPVHEAHVTHNPSYKRSIKLRDHTTT